MFCTSKNTLQILFFSSWGNYKFKLIWNSYIVFFPKKKKSRVIFEVKFTYALIRELVKASKKKDYEILGLLIKHWKIFKLLVFAFS